MKKTIYKTAKSENLDTLDATVNEALAEGYTLYGNPFVSKNITNPVYCQALTKEEQKSPSPLQPGGF